MRVLLIGEAENDKIPQALRRDRILFDHIRMPDTEPLIIPEGLYDVIVLLTSGAGKTVTPQLVTLLPSLRAGGISIPLLVVASHLSARDRIHLLDAGADDVLTQPYLLGEMMARIRALGRRSPVLQPQLLEAGDLSLDRGHCILTGPTGDVRLSCKELQLVELFLMHAGQVLPRKTLWQKVWGMDAEAAYNAIEVYLSLVRRKLRAVGSTAQIRAERGIGYYLEP